MYPSPNQQAVDENTPLEQLRILARESIELARLVAKNPSADSELLEELGAINDKATREGVASNPNTPTQLLLHLGKEFPQQLLANPVFFLLLLENPNLPAEMPTETLRSLLRQNEVTISFLEQASHQININVLIDVARHPNTPERILEQMVKKMRDSALDRFLLDRCIAERPNMSESLLEKLVEHGSEYTQLDLARHPNITEELLDKIADIQIYNWNLRIAIRQTVARKINTTCRVLERLARDTSYGVKRTVIHKLLDYLAGSNVSALKAILH